MSDLKLFRIDDASATELTSSAVALEKTLQRLLEQNLETMLGVRFLATEYTTGRTHAGRIDTLGIDENGCPVIIEYKRTLNENVINQGLFYLDWLLDHQAEFVILVSATFGQDASESIDWSGTRLLCIASDYTRYDTYAVQQISRNIELLRYRMFGEGLIALELVNSAFGRPAPAAAGGGRTSDHVRTPAERVSAAAPSVLDLYENLRAFILALGDDVQEKQLKRYVAFARIRNIVCVVTHADKLTLFVRIDSSTVELQPGFTRDVRTTGHWGTGDLEITLRTPSDLERAKPILLKSYESS